LFVSSQFTMETARVPRHGALSYGGNTPFHITPRRL
jgi:hypothetical protein